MRLLSAEFVGRYLAAAGREAVGAAGAYELYGIGLQLLDRIEGAVPTSPGGTLVPLFQSFERSGSWPRDWEAL